MALNWAMIDANQRPVPLPEEKIWLAVEKCQMSLEFKEAKAKWEAKGTVYVTNQRVVFLRIPPLPQPAEQSEASQHLRSLNVPLTHLVDSRYLIPIFGAPYYEASVLPVPGGNLPEACSGGAASKGLCKIWFNEGGGAAFRDAVEEVRNLARGGQHGEQLPLYQPPSAPSGSAAPSIAATANSSLESRTVAGDYSERSSVAGPSYTSGRPSSRASQLSAQDLDAARVAHREEEAEREAIRQRAEAGAAAPGMEETQVIAASQAQQAGQAMDDDEPPAYAMVSPVTTYVRAQEGESSCESGRQRRAREFKVSLSRVMRSDEGRDRILQLCLGLALLTHHSFGSVRHPRSYGMYPIPHIFFFFFSRSVRREALTGMRYTGQAAEKSRKLLLLLRWLRGLLWTARQERESSRAHDKRMTEARSTQHTLEQRRRNNSDTHETQSTKINPEELTYWQQRLAHLGEVLASVGEAADIAAFLGGSTIAWKTIRGGYGEPGKKALRRRQRHILDRIALR
ncbi:hypothetical protein BCV69DRAFT_262089 [Microstroma glucosiphilum]|uniref:GRAM domain-containing protein n=1 Tax=Pseudomicrostroma glucosiphilum TaxID=1684307 RepID=A0A316U1Y2_9BASI|nr:hypothetical protein BCV69DRAFT_262089 [Pseudomicrostroma glucosiphilum]PWN19220.1 hypothetical protein BCV69DRAFT_262089 [Pseudomicrostroma glucosiphilum]